MKVYVVGGDYEYAKWMNLNKDAYTSPTIVRSMDDADFVVFTGGEDVTPLLYNEKAHPFTLYNSERDAFEADQFVMAIEKKKPMVGICRGSQFLCVMSGGKLVQHQAHPSFIHSMKTFDGKELMISSTHHQAQFPFNMVDNEDYHILGWTENLLDYHENGDQLEMYPPKECEIVFYPKTRCLAIQGHPEMMDMSHPTIPYLRELLSALMNNSMEEKIQNKNLQIGV
jgi:gamma-glutamyl-gamma-aminobutyrate hydrolase PuuD